MTTTKPNRSNKLLALIHCPSATPAERDTARLRLREATHKNTGLPLKHKTQAGRGDKMNAQILFIVCFSASLAAIGIALACAGLMLILKSER